MRLVDLNEQPDLLREAAAELLVESFRGLAPRAWPDLPAAREEVGQALAPDKIARAALNAEGTLLGWIGGIPQYGGKVWELHPLVVAPAHQRRGIGRALVADLEARAAARGGLTLWAGSDDETGLTSLAGADLYPEVWRHIRDLRDLRGHPFRFYEKCGFVVAGLMPDANGLGKPDIYLAKRITQ
jgi:aminoglycoside 6'-N-acetyltransferase I